MAHEAAVVHEAVRRLADGVEAVDGRAFGGDGLEEGEPDGAAGRTVGEGAVGGCDGRLVVTRADEPDGRLPATWTSGPGAGGAVGDSASGDEALSNEERALDVLAGSFGLSAWEADVLRDYATGRTARYIADWYMISEHTVKTHLRRAYAKLGIHSRQELLDLVDETVAQSYRSAAS